jgi:hypothetical protein
LLERAIVRAHDWFNQDPNDQRTTLWNLRYGVEWGPGHEAVAGAPLHFVLGVLAIGVWLWRRAWRGVPLQAMLLCIGGTALCCLALKWQPAGARLQLPIFLLLAPIISWAASTIGATVVSGVAVLALLGWVPFSETHLRPWRTQPTIFATNRWENYFRFHPAQRRYADAVLAKLVTAQPVTVQIVSRHGFPYPIMKEIRAQRLALFWGDLPAATAAPPGAVLVTEIGGQKLPSEFRPAGATEAFELVPGLEPYGLYLPRTTVNAPPPNAR